MKRLKFLLLAVMAVLYIGVQAPQPAAAFNPFSGVNCTGYHNSPSQSPVCQSKNSPTKGDPLTGPRGFIKKIADFIALIAGIAAVILLIIAGLRFITAGGSAEAVASARSTIIYTAVGIAVILIAHTLVVLIIGSL